jgi:hypothetical protein
MMPSNVFTHKETGRNNKLIIIQFSGLFHPKISTSVKLKTANRHNLKLLHQCNVISNTKNFHTKFVAVVTILPHKSCNTSTLQVLQLYFCFNFAFGYLNLLG